MNCPDSVNPSENTELDVVEVLRRRRQQMHDAIDDQFESMAIELGVELDARPQHRVGISFEPSVQLQFVPSLTEEVTPGFYALRHGERDVEVLPCVQQGRVHFELIDEHGHTQVHWVETSMFRLLFRKKIRSRLSLGGKSQPTRYGIDPSNPTVALRHNPDGSTDRGRFDHDGHFVSDE